MDPVRRVWRDQYVVRVEYGEGKTVGLTDLSHGALRAASRAQPFASEISAACGTTEHVADRDDLIAAAKLKAPAKMSSARGWMIFGGAVTATGAAWLLTTGSPLAWTLIILGGLRFAAGFFDYREGQRWAAGAWEPRSQESEAKTRRWVLVGLSILVLLAIALIAYGATQGR